MVLLNTFSGFTSVVPQQQHQHLGANYAGVIGSPTRSPAATHAVAPVPEKLHSWSRTTAVVNVALPACFMALSSGALHTSKRGLAGRGRRLSCAATSNQAALPNEATEEGDFNTSMQYGVCAPCGEPGVSYWDPAGLANNINADTFRQYRRAELKHGRICMLAVLGLITQHTWRFKPFFDQNTDDFSLSPSGIGAASPEAPSAAYIGLIVLIAGIIELSASDDNREPGDFGDPCQFAKAYGLNVDEPDDMALWKNFELNHCRLAMVGFLGAVTAELASGLDAVDQWRMFGSAWRRTTAILFFNPQEPVLDLLSY